MANKKITELPDATLPITTGVKFEAVQGGLNVKVDADDMPGSGAAGVTSVTGTASRITSTGGATPAINIDAAYDTAITALVATKLDRNLTVKTKTADYTLEAADLTDLNAGKDIIFLMNVASANTFTVPPNATIDVDAGGHIYILRIGLGQTTVVAGAGVTIGTSAGNLLDPGLNVLMPLIQTADNQWYLQNGTGGNYLPWNPGWTGFSVIPTSVDATYSVFGKLGHVRLSGTVGTSNANTMTITSCPIAPRNNCNWLMMVMNNGTVQTGRVDMPAGNTTFQCYSTPAAAAWTTSGSKFVYLSLIFEVA